MHMSHVLVGLGVSAVLGMQAAAPPAGMIRDAAAREFALVVKGDGSVVGWGRNSDGLGARAGGGVIKSPVAIPLPGKARQVAVGSLSAYALLEDGTVVAWGQNTNGQLGNGPMGASNDTGKNPKESMAPVRVTGLSGIVQISAGARHALALRSDGTVWAWGQRQNGALGDGEPKTLPALDATGAVKVPGLEGITQVATYWTHNLALRRDGHVLAWGSNNYGELGLGTRARGWRPAEIPGLDHVVEVVAGGSSEGVSGALRDDGTVWVWGADVSGQMGNGLGPLSPDAPGGRTLSPVQVPGLSGVKHLAMGDGHAAVLLGDGTLRLWGHDGWGQIGVGTAGGYHAKPTKVTALTDVTSIYLGQAHTFAVRADGSFWIWGFGFLGDGLLSRNLHVPTRLDLP